MPQAGRMRYFEVSIHRNPLMISPDFRDRACGIASDATAEITGMERCTPRTRKSFRENGSETDFK